MEDRHPKYKISDIYPDIDDNATDEIISYRHQFEKLLNFFDRLAYALFNQKTIKKKDLSYFGWYLNLIKKNQDMVDYCESYGFQDVIKLALEINGD